MVNFYKNLKLKIACKKIHTHIYVVCFVTFILLCLQIYAPPNPVSAVSNQQIISGMQTSYAEALRRLGIITGYEDGSLHLEYPIKRSEFSTLVVKLMGYDINKTQSDGLVSFKDVPSDHWAFPYVQTAYSAGYVKGYPDGTFGPDNQITYAEAITVLTKALGYSGSPSKEWPGNFIDKAKEIQLLKDIELTPGHSMTRGEICILLYNSLTIDYGR